MRTPRSLHRYVPILLASILALASLACSAIVTTLPVATEATPTAATIDQPPPSTATPRGEETATSPPVSEPTVVPTEAPVVAKEAEQLGPTRELKPVVSPTVAGADVPLGRWQAIPDLPRQVNALVCDPSNPRILYAGTGLSGAGSGVYQSKDAGLTWRLAAEGLPSEDMRALAFSRAEPDTLYVAAGHRGDVFASNDGAQSWTHLGNYELTGFSASMVVAPSDANVLYVTEDVRGLYRSLDGGHTWLALSEGLPKDDNGTVNVQAVAIHPTETGVVYVGTGWHSANGNGVYKSTDGGETWTPANRGMIDYGITALAINPMNPQIAYAGGANGELFKSADGGESWTDITDRLPTGDTFHQRILSIAIVPGNPETVYLLHERAGVLVTADGGEAWRLLGKPAELEYPTFTAMGVLFGSQPVVVVGVREEGGWRYAAP